VPSSNGFALAALYVSGGSESSASMTRADGIFGVWDLRRGSLSRAWLTGRSVTDPPIGDGGCGVAAADRRDFGVLLAGGGTSVDDSRFRFEGVDVGVLLGRGGGGIGDCCAREGVRVEGPAAAPEPVGIGRGKFALVFVVVTIGVFGPPD
jgi:hypothetical protein